MKKLKIPFLFALACLPAALIAGFFVLQYQLELLPTETIEQLMEQAGSKGVLMAVGLIQTAVIVMLAAFFGRILSEKLGLWKPLRFEKQQILKTLLLSVPAGIVLAGDYWAPIPGVQEAAEAGMTVWGVLASVFYGGIIEELLMRLFVLSLIGFLLWKLFWRKQEKVPETALILANVLAALLFAAGHLPATVTTFGSLTPLLVLRCFLLNGGFGLIFGRLYRKYGIQYAMAGHALCHIVSKLIWWIAI